MFVLFLKTTENAATSLDFVCACDSKDEAKRYVPQEFGELLQSGYGNYRMLGSQGKIPKSVEETKIWTGSSYVLAEF